ncbi:hypothetical protein ACJIZ3_014365 [Penstemon smallii]|uniref:NADH dehydrogenase subunit 4L n=1 Tax=Penstemon smallii TaxID=265156 RepID=A0ABD3RLA5_9LAMI
MISSFIIFMVNSFFFFGYILFFGKILYTLSVYAIITLSFLSY